MPPTLRLRLTLLYGALFIVAGAGVLGITYGLFAQGTSQDQASVQGIQLRFPSTATPGASTPALTPPRGKVHTTTVARAPRTALAPARAGAGSAPPFIDGGPGFIRALRSSGQKQIDRLVKRANVVLQTQRSQSLTSLLAESGIALAIMALLSIGLGWLLAGRALRPLRTMNLRARKITEDTLHERLGLAGRRDELGELAATFDTVLARLEQAFESQRRFVANASHELRTPITLERALLEVALADPDATVGSLRETCERVLAAGEQQEHVINALLTLARGQAGLDAARPVSLDTLTRELLSGRVDAMAGIGLDGRLDPVTVSGDRALLERMVANLLDNAIVHNHSCDGWMTVQTGTVEGRAQLRIANSGALVPGARAAELFEPFRRLEDDRTGTGAGLGLGLSIVRAVAVAHGGQVVATPLPEGGLELVVTLPLAAGQADRREPSLHSEADGSTDGVLAGPDRVHR